MAVCFLQHSITFGNIYDFKNASRAKTVINRFAAQSPIVTFGGDTFGSSGINKKNQGASSLLLLGALGVQVASVGNHEFDGSVGGLENAIQQFGKSPFPWLNGSLIYSNTKEPLENTVPWWIQEHQGLRIGYFAAAVGSCIFIPQA